MMNLSLIKRSWILELIIIVVVIFAINSCIYMVKFGSISYIIYQLIYLACFVLLLFLAQFHVKELGGQLSNHLKNKILFTDIFIILFLIVFIKVSYNILIEINFVKVLDTKFFFSKPNFDHHLSNVESLFIVFISTTILITGVFAEELYFRCYLFEKQHNTFKSYTWLINGFSWSIYHLFTPTNFLALLPGCLMYSYVYQRRRNIWITILTHLISNFIAFYPVLKTYLK